MASRWPIEDIGLEELSLGLRNVRIPVRDLDEQANPSWRITSSQVTEPRFSRGDVSRYEPAPRLARTCGHRLPRGRQDHAPGRPGPSPVLTRHHPAVRFFVKALAYQITEA
jgi:hypothetical protein